LADLNAQLAFSCKTGGYIDDKFDAKKLTSVVRRIAYWEIISDAKKIPSPVA